MRVAGKIVAETHELIQKEIHPGITTGKLDAIANDFIRSKGAIPSFKGKLADGDIVSIDIGAIYKGYQGDAARTIGIGKISDEARRLIDVTEQSFFEGIKFAKTGNHLHEISAAIQKHAESNGFSIVREFVGHGIGKQMHEEPQIPNYKPANRGPRLVKGMVLAIEPMVNAGTFEVYVLKDNWTVVTRDARLSAHYENTVLVTDDEPELFTLI
ncbi:methionine aminopeptidase [Holotrichia oblita]|nr:methionine aminopeptidase [Holotrichia oblita]